MKMNKSVLQRGIIFILCSCILFSICPVYAFAAENQKERVVRIGVPDDTYDKINEKINALEMMYEQTEEGMRNAETEKARNSMEAKLNAIRYKIDELKRQSELIKAQIESKNNNKNMIKIKDFFILFSLIPLLIFLTPVFQVKQTY